MNQQKLIIFFLFQVLLIILLVILALTLIKIKKALKKEKRIVSYTLKNPFEVKESLGDDLFKSWTNRLNIMSKSLSEKIFFQNYAKKYNKYQNKDNDYYFSYRVIIKKIMISLGVTLIYLISSLINNSFNLLYLVIMMILSYYFLDFYLKLAYQRRIKLIENDLLKAIIIMNNAFKSGYNITQAVDIVVKDLTGPICEEFIKISNDLKYGLEVKDVFNRFYERIKIDDAKYITSSLSLLNLTGGNIVGVFANIEKALTNKKRLRDELNAMTSSSNLVYKILIAMPIILILIILMVNPDYFKPLFTSIIGYLIIFVCLFIFGLYIYLIKKILKVDV